MDDSSGLPLVCSKCQHEMTRSVRWVQENTFFTCPQCGANVLIDKDAAMALLAQKQRTGD